MLGKDLKVQFAYVWNEPGDTGEYSINHNQTLNLAVLLIVFLVLLWRSLELILTVI